MFDPKTDKLLRRIRVSNNILQDHKNKTVGRLSAPIVETHGDNCDQTWVYLVIFERGARTIYNGSKLWRQGEDVSLLSSHPNATNFSIVGEKFNPLPGLHGLALAPTDRKTPGSSRRLFFRSASYVQQNSISVDDLQKLAPNEDICSTAASQYRFSSPFTGQAFSQDGILFFGMGGERAIGCWNMKTPLNADHLKCNMTRAAKNADREPSSTSWVYKWSPLENTGPPGAYFHGLDHGSWSTPTIFRYHEEFLAKNREKLIDGKNKGGMGNVIPWLMSMSLIGAQNLGTFSRPDVISQELLPPLDSLGYYGPSGERILGPGVSPTKQLGKDSAQPFAKLSDDYGSGRDGGLFQNRVNSDIAANSDIRTVNVQAEEYKTQHKYYPPEENGFEDEYAGPAMEQVYSWRTVDFEFDSEVSRQRAVDAGHYELENALPLGIEVWRDKIFVTLPRWKKGIPATLATIPRYSTEKSPKLRPYPSWGWHDPGNCDGLISVFRVQVDECDRLWVLDSGQTEITIDPKQTCPPKVFIFDLKTDKLIKVYTMPKDYVKQDSLYSNIAVDVRDGECDSAVAYLADVWRFGIVVYDLFKDKSFRIQHHFFFPDPLSSRYELHGLNFQWTDGIFGLSLSPVDINNDRTLFFHPMSSFREFAVSASILKDESAAEDNPEMFIPIGKPRAKYSGHSSGSAMDRHGVMFFNMVTRDSVWCWDSRKEYIPQNLGVIGQSNVSLVFPNDIKIDHEPDQSIWVLSNKLPMYLYGKMNPQEINFRLLRANVKDAIKNTVCDPNYIVPPSEQSYDETC